MIKKSIDELAKMSGENMVKSAPKYMIPTLTLNGKEGIFYLSQPDEKGVWQKKGLGNSVKGVMLKVRRNYFEFSKDYRLFTNEHDSPNDFVVMFETKKTLKGVSTSKIDSGKISEIKMRYPKLKMIQSVYFLMEGDIVKLRVKGKGLTNLFEFYKTLEPKEHIFQFEIVLGSIKETSSLGDYYAMTFEKGKEIKDLNDIAKKLGEVVDNLALIDDYYSAREMDEVEAKKIVDEIPIIEEGKEEEEIVDPDILEQDNY